MVVVSFDPGLTGAFAVLDHNGLRAVCDVPTMKIPDIGPQAKVQKKIDARALFKLLRQHVRADDAVSSAIESVSTMGGANNAVQTQGSLMRSLGAIETVLECLGWSPQYIHPQNWKRFYGLIDSKLTTTQRKKKASDCARRLFPDCASISLAKHHNRAEAILLGHFFMRIGA